MENVASQAKIMGHFQKLAQVAITNTMRDSLHQGCDTNKTVTWRCSVQD